MSESIKIQRSYWLDPATVEALEAYAEVHHNASRSVIVEKAIQTFLENS